MKAYKQSNVYYNNYSRETNLLKCTAINTCLEFWCCLFLRRFKALWITSLWVVLTSQYSVRAVSSQACAVFHKKSAWKYSGDAVSIRSHHANMSIGVFSPFLFLSFNILCLLWDLPRRGTIAGLESMFNPYQFDRDLGTNKVYITRNQNSKHTFIKVFWWLFLWIF